ncbi:MAG: YicC/YloC family endoribonuclease, partial [Candidatus Kappaea frigidicola]|nr:YicC/YloC family endoribonuclease [Candidatus Kappaea frigidicola]
MLKSMTGYGLGKASFASGLITVEIKSLNYRYLEISVRLPEEISHFEKKIKELIQQKVSRGRISVIVNIEKKDESDYKLKVNKKLINSYYNTLKNIKREFKLKDNLTLNDILKCPDIIALEKKTHPDYKKWNKAKKAIDDSVKDLLKSRVAEGKFIFKDLNTRANNIATLLTKVKKRLPLVIKNQRSRYLKKVTAAEKAELKTKKNSNEFFALAQSYDIAEEITRINAHIKTLKKSMTRDSEVGKKLDFIAQELIREANTVAAKTQDYSITSSVIEIKAEIEKIREQVQNVE